MNNYITTIAFVLAIAIYSIIQFIIIVAFLPFVNEWLAEANGTPEETNLVDDLPEELKEMII